MVYQGKDNTIKGNMFKILHLLQILKLLLFLPALFYEETVGISKFVENEAFKHLELWHNTFKDTSFQN